MLPDSRDKETENSVSSLEIAFDFVERIIFCFVFILITDKTADLTNMADRGQLFSTKLHPYALYLRILSPSTNKMFLQAIIFSNLYKNPLINLFYVHLQLEYP